MAIVRITRNLNRFFPDLTERTVSGATVREIVDNLEAIHPGLRSYLLEDNGSLRKHVNIFVDKEMIRDRRTLEMSVADGAEVFIAQALSGG